MTADEFERRLAEAEPETAEWVEVHLTGHPPGFPRYDFTFRSDRDAWEHLPRIVRRALTSWRDVQVRRRYVRRSTWSSPWEDVRPEETSDGP